LAVMVVNQGVDDARPDALNAQQMVSVGCKLQS
jgi:hypothetical protein